MPDGIDVLIESVIVDAYGEDEQLSAFCQAFEEEARFPLRATVVGADLDITGVDYDGNEQRGLRARCLRHGRPYEVALLDVVPAGPLTLKTSQLLNAYRRWACADPLPALPVPVFHQAEWVYPGFAPAPTSPSPPLTGNALVLHPHGQWDPAEQYWGAPGQLQHRLLRNVIAAGARSCFELPPPADHSSSARGPVAQDPIARAIQLQQQGRHQVARAILDALTKSHPERVGAWCELGLMALHTRGPAVARRPFELGLTMAETALPDGFNGVIDGGLTNNQPFLGCLHGLGLCDWRQRRWDGAEAIFTALVWLDPTRADVALASLDAIQSRQRWTRPR